jgi:hypothetical protein
MKLRSLIQNMDRESVGEPGAARLRLYGPISVPLGLETKVRVSAFAARESVARQKSDA